MLFFFFLEYAVLQNQARHKHRCYIFVFLSNRIEFFQLGKPIESCLLKLNLKVCAGGGYENVLVVGSDALSRYVDWTDRGTCILFGDASGALLLQV